MSNERSQITTHVLDTAAGAPAAGVPVVLEFQKDGDWREIGRGKTDRDGRVKDLALGRSLASGLYRLTFGAGAYLASRGQRSFFQDVPIQFLIEDLEAHYHVPLLLSPFGYSTYRGS